MNLRALKYLVKLAELQHFSPCRRGLLCQPAHAQHADSQARRRAGCAAGRARAAQCAADPGGQGSGQRARHVLRDIEQIHAAARRSRDPETGTLRLGLFPTLAPYLLPHVVPGIRKRFPQLKLQLAEEKTADILRLLEDGKLDAGLLALPVDVDSLEQEVLFDEPFVMALPNDHPLADQQQVQLKDLDGSELLLLEDGHCLRDHALEVCALAGAHERVDFHATSMETLRQMVAAEVGITLMPLLAVKPPIASTEQYRVPTVQRTRPRAAPLCWCGASPRRWVSCCARWPTACATCRRAYSPPEPVQASFRPRPSLRRYPQTAAWKDNARRYPAAWPGCCCPARPGRHFQGGGKGAAGGDTAKDAFATGQRPRSGDRFFVSHRHVQVENVTGPAPRG